MPTSTGFVNVNFTVTEGGETVNRSVNFGVYGLNVTATGTLAPGVLPNTTQGSAYTATFVATGGSGQYEYFASGFTGGLNLDEMTGVLSGTISAGTGPFSFSVGAVDGANPELFYQKRFSIDVVGVPAVLPSVTNFGNLIRDCTVGVPCDITIGVTAGGTAPFQWEAPDLPPGLSIRWDTSEATSLTPGYVQIWGTPTTAGPKTITLTVKDALNVTATNTYPLNVSARRLPTPRR